MPAASFIVGRSPADDDPIVRDGEIVHVPLLLRDGSTVDVGGGLMMADGTDLAHRLRLGYRHFTSRMVAARSPATARALPIVRNS